MKSREDVEQATGRAAEQLARSRRVSPVRNWLTGRRRSVRPMWVAVRTLSNSLWRRGRYGVFQRHRYGSFTPAAGCGSLVP
jgi:hypothetical protein